MTIERAKRIRLIFRFSVSPIVLTPIVLAIYGLAHPVWHRVLLTLLGAFVVPVLLTIIVQKSPLHGLLGVKERIDTTSVKAVLRHNPTVLLGMPLIFMGMPWAFLLAALAVKVGDKREWLRQHAVRVLFSVMTPQIVLAYLCVSMGAKPLGVYIAACLVYFSVSAAINGLTLEKGIAKFFGSYKAQASPLVILTLALFCCLSFGLLHFTLWTVSPAEYSGISTIGDAMYFSVVTMATVGYGDILPLGRTARWLSVAEIVSGVLLLVVGVSASMTVWLQTNQPQPDPGSKSQEVDQSAKGAEAGKPADPAEGVAV